MSYHRALCAFFLFLGNCVAFAQESKELFPESGAPITQFPGSKLPAGIIARWHDKFPDVPHLPGLHENQDPRSQEPSPKLLSSAPTDVPPTWVARYHGSGNGGDTAVAIAVDDIGNVYVTGYSTGSGTASDYLTVKYDPSGNEQWVVRYNGSGNSYDRAVALAVDGSGSVYVTGYSHGDDSYLDYATVKYNVSGEEDWVRRYDGPGRKLDSPTGLVIGPSGCVYVTGFSRATSYDYATIKYSSDGTVRWVARYDGSGSDYAVALVVDSNENIYVTGYSRGSETSYDYATIKYNADGEQKWVGIFDGSESSGDYAVALATDDLGNVFVTGYSQVFNGPYEFATVKYDSAGNEAWARSYGGDIAVDIAVDALGNAYVTGLDWDEVEGAFDCATVKYDPVGNEQWVALYEEPAYNESGGNAIAIDAWGDIYVTGSNWSGTNNNYLTIKYDPSGAELWRVIYDGQGISNDYARSVAVDGAGYVYVTGYGNDDYVTIKYNPSGGEEWMERYIGSGNPSDIATDIDVDGSGNVYVTGSTGYGIFNDYITIKYDPSGSEQWSARYDGQAQSDDKATALAVDGFGNVYVTGSSIGLNESSDCVTIKYDATGVEQWVARYDGPGNYYDKGVAIAFDGSGNVYVAGSSSGIDRNSDYLLVKYDISGVEQWVATYNGYAANALAVDGLGNAYVTGDGWVSGSRENAVTVKYDASGNEQWAVHYNGPENDSDRGTDITVDKSGNVYVAAYSWGPIASIDYATIKYDASGAELWVARYDAGGEAPSAIAVDSSGNVYVTGFSSVSPATESDYATVKYDSSGHEQWVATYNGGGGSEDEATDLVVDVSGNVYVTGSSGGSGTMSDYATIKYDPLGTEQWVARYNGSGNGEDAAVALALDGSGNVFITGYSTGSGTGLDFVTIKYANLPTNVNDGPQVPLQFDLSQNYPNPFNPTTTISFSLPRSGDATLEVFNMLGEKVATLISGSHEMGIHTVVWEVTAQPSGVYFYRLQAGGFTETRKLVLLR